MLFEKWRSAFDQLIQYYLSLGGCNHTGWNVLSARLRLPVCWQHLYQRPSERMEGGGGGRGGDQRVTLANCWRSETKVLFSPQGNGNGCRPTVKPPTTPPPHPYNTYHRTPKPLPPRLLASFPDEIIAGPFKSPSQAAPDWQGTRKWCHQEETGREGGRGGAVLKVRKKYHLQQGLDPTSWFRTHCRVLNLQQGFRTCCWI